MASSVVSEEFGDAAAAIFDFGLTLGMESAGSSSGIS